jgi:hypothetical protein
MKFARKIVLALQNCNSSLGRKKPSSLAVLFLYFFLMAALIGEFFWAVTAQ